MSLERTVEPYKLAAKRGYRVTEKGQLLSPKGAVLRPHENSSGYLSFGLRMGLRRGNVTVHRLQALQKFGPEVFSKDLVVRHLDGDKKNNSRENIGLGTPSDNALDIPVEQRKAAARSRQAAYSAEMVRQTGRKISQQKSKLSSDQVASLVADKEAGMDYTDLAHKYGISRSSAHRYANLASRELARDYTSKQNSGRFA